MELKSIIKTKKEYKHALIRAEKLMELPDGSPEDEELEILALLIDDYENRNYPIEPPDPIEAIKFRMEQNGYTNKDLAKVIGGANRASEILKGKRKLTINMIRNLISTWNMSADSLLGKINV